MDSGLDMFLAVQGAKSKVKGISVLYFVMISARDHYISSFDRALEQRHDDLALKQNKDDEGGYQNQDRAGAQQGDVGGVVSLERPQRTSHRSFRWILDQHQGKEKLVPRPDGHKDSKRSDRRLRKRYMDSPE